MVKPILVLQQVAHEGLGRLYPILRRAGATEQVVPCYLEGAAVPKSLADYGALVLLGGPMSAIDAEENPTLSAQVDLCREAIERDFPTLGICLGGQLLAHAGGARVFPGETPEIGWYDVHLSLESHDDPLFTGLPNPLPVFQWHGDGFDLPAGALHLASSPLFPHQAFRLGENVYGVQFHLEVEEPMVKEWMAVNAAELERLRGTIEAPAVTADAAARCAALASTCDTVVTRWLERAAAHGR
jgi:GMP synthase (glutamine-hydrolysing)